MKIEGRLRNFVDYALVLMLLGCLFLLSNAFAFYSASLQSFQSGISLFGAILMSLPMARYYINLSAKKDGSCDYINIYLQSGIQKCGLFSIAVLIVYLQSSTFVAYPISFTVTLAIRLGTYIVFLIFMIAQKFAVRFSHFKIFIAIIVVSQSSRILT